MQLHEHLIKAREAAKTKAAKRRASQVFRIDWRSTQSEIVVGWKAICALLGIKENTLAARLSTGRGSYSVRRVNPVHGEMDVLTVTRMSAANAEKRLRGRPPMQVDWERMGSEAPGNPDGMTLAYPKKKPKS